jgi:hypothetical protein
MRLLHEIARDVEQATEATGASSSSTAATSLALHVELECHLSCLSDSILLGSSRVLEIVSLCPFNTVLSTYSLALRLLLIKQLRSLCHGHSDQLVLPPLRILVASRVEHLCRLHGCCSTNVVGARLLIAASTATIEVLVLLHGILFIDVVILSLVLVQHTKGHAEEVGIA